MLGEIFTARIKIFPAILRRLGCNSSSHNCRSQKCLLMPICLQQTFFQMCQFPVIKVRSDNMISFSHRLIVLSLEWGLRGHPLKSEFGAPNSLLATIERQSPSCSNIPKSSYDIPPFVLIFAYSLLSLPRNGHGTNCPEVKKSFGEIKKPSHTFAKEIQIV